MSQSQPSNARLSAGVVFLVLGACSSDPPLPGKTQSSPQHTPDAGASEASGTDTQSGAGSETTDLEGSDSQAPDTDGSPPQPLVCEAPEFPQDDEPLPFELLDAQVVDQDGEGVAGMIAQVCGLNLCLSGKTDARGFIHHDEPAAVSRVAFKYGDGVHYAQFARLLTDGASYDLGPQTTVAFPALDSAQPLQSGQVVSSRDIELDLHGVTARIDLLSFPNPEEQGFVAAQLEPGRWPDAVPRDLGIEQIVALGPLKTAFCPPAKLTLPNFAEWPEETAVEILLHIVDTANHWGAYGSFEPVARAHVSSDGKTITTDDDSGLPELGVIGLRPYDESAE